ncbi:Type II secretion system protein G precursor [Posidoniimonas corsicana]|uniref:Type II secretion system protein G n=1 Tax=Posidoniimonas corsicana TaxID=1938618 RepID=A0A5C5V399_9BACT|nr:DUF1559 domain-containing protein [Posidoniimonas corsicana]TWT32490.1 Type II secretion system protein G precursor [Posidoniimonas corsicana]
MKIHPVRRRRQTGFTLVELLVVIAVIGVLIALLLPAVQSARESSRRAACQNSLRQVGIAIVNFESTQNRFPAGKKWSSARSNPNSFDYSWSSFILPHLEEGAIYREINFSRAATDPENIQAASQLIPAYLCPSAVQLEAHRSAEGRLINLGGQPGEGMACIDYLGISGPDKDKANPVTGEDYGRQRGVLLGTKGLPNEDTITEPPKVTTAKITDGLSKTIMVIECSGRGVDMNKHGEIKSYNGAWVSGDNISHIKKGINDEVPPAVWEDERVFSDHPGGAHALACDGSVHFLNQGLEPEMLRSLCSRDGDELVEGLGEL